MKTSNFILRDENKKSLQKSNKWKHIFFKELLEDKNGTISIIKDRRYIKISQKEN
jgi:type IV secretory pathway VirB9-like protein